MTGPGPSDEDVIRTARDAYLVHTDTGWALVAQVLVPGWDAPRAAPVTWKGLAKWAVLADAKAARAEYLDQQHSNREDAQF